MTASGSPTACRKTVDPPYCTKTCHPDGLGESAQARAADGAHHQPHPLPNSRFDGAPHATNPGREGSMVLVVVCPRGIGSGPTLPSNGSGRRQVENLINRFHTHPFPRIITTD